MLKIIKKTVNFILITGVSLILMPLTLLLILRIPLVQTYVVQGVAKYISTELKSTVSVGKVDFAYLNRIILEDVLIKDNNSDTLIYARKVNAGIRELSPKKNIIRLGRVHITDPLFALITDSSGTSNLNWYLDKLSSDSTDTTKGGSSLFQVAKIDITGGRFELIDRTTDNKTEGINFSDLRLGSMNGAIENLIIAGDSLSLNISDMALKESNGFGIRDMNSNLLIHGPNIILSNTSIICDSSIINADRIALLADSSSSFSRFLQEVKLDVILKKSLINLTELNYFVPFIKNINESVWISGHVSGTISELKGRNINLSYKDQTNLDCNFDFSGLPDFRNTFMYVDINDFRSTSHDVEQITIPGKGKLLVPEPLRKLGVVSFSGTFTGFSTDFVTYGKINTNKGIISTDISLRPEEKNKFRIKGLIKGTSIDLGAITGSEIPGKLTVEANVDGSTESFKTFSVNLKGKVDSVDLNNYRYRNIDLNGFFTDKGWDGDIKVNDQNINMELLGRFDFSRDLPEFDFTMNLKKARLYNLKIATKDTTAAASLLLTANFRGDNIDNLDGEIKLLNSSFRKYGNDLQIFDFSLKTFLDNHQPTISLRTDFLDASLIGHYNFASLGPVADNVLASLVPSKYAGRKQPLKTGENDFRFQVTFKKTDELNKFLMTGLKVAPNSIISGRVRPDSILFVSGKSSSFSLGSLVFNGLQLNARYSDTTARVNLTSEDLNLAGISDLKDLWMDLGVVPDHYTFLLSWDNKDKDLNKGNFEAEGSFNRVNGKKESSIMNLFLKPGEVDIRDQVWKISPANITMDSSSIRIDKFSVRNNDRYFLVNGAVSEDLNDTLYLKFNDISLSPLNKMSEKNTDGSDNSLKLNIGGTLNGRISFTDLYRNFMFESDILLHDFTLLNSQYGDIKILSAWNNDRKVAEINANNNLAGVSMFKINGIYTPSEGNMDLLLDANKLPIDALNPLLNFFASGVGGKATGKIRVKGQPAKPLLLGSLWLEDAALKVDYLQTRYRFTDSIRFDSQGIKFNNIKLKDEKGNQAMLNGTVYHDHFNDFSVDISLKPQNCMVLNTKPKDNELFYGTAFASGVTSIKTVGPLLKLDISAKTDKNTKFFIPLNTGSSVTQGTFISFVQPSDAGKEVKAASNLQTGPTSSGMEIGFDLEVTPDAEVQLLMDPKTGDIIKGTGRGNLNINLDSKGAFKIFGDYTIEDGDYLFTLGNIINKSFGVESGGKITFNGDVEDADIDIKAIYKTKASLYDIMPGILPESKQNERIPVECQLLLSGKLFNPTVGFDIYLPTADEETRAYLKSMIKSEEEMSRQFLFLLVMNSFYSDQNAATNPFPSGMGTTTVGVTTMEMLSNQLSNWLSQISNDFDIGVVYRPGTTQLPNSQELQVALSTQLLNDKVVINGNFDVAGSQASGTSGAVTGTNTFTGVFNVEYKINEKIRFKFFNRSNDNFYIDNGILYTQGIGLFYRQDFDKFKDLFKRQPAKGDMKKEKKVGTGTKK